MGEGTDAKRECPPAVDHGVFLVDDGGYNAGLVTASGDKLPMKLRQEWRTIFSDHIMESVQICFHREGEVCKLSFRVVARSKKGVRYTNWETTIADHGLPLTG